MAKIFIVEDDGDIRELVAYALRSSGFETYSFESAPAFLEELKNTDPDLVLLDIMLPGDDGLSILKRLRNNSRYNAAPVIMLTAKGSELDKVKGLDMGADDYIVKPFGVMELISRVNAVLRRAVKESGTNAKCVYKDISVDNDRHTVTVDGERISLTYKEYELLRYLIINSEIVLSRSRIMDEIWGYDFEGESRTVDMHIKTLRQKLGASGELIKTIRNVGYKIGE